MITENLSALKINKMTQEQYDREHEAGNLSASELYLTPMADHVVEQDIDGIWRYRKWASGCAECWANITRMPENGCIAGIELPTFLINRLPRVFPHFAYNSTDGVGFGQAQVYGNSGAYCFHMYVRRAGGAVATSNSDNTCVYVEGRWK